MIMKFNKIIMLGLSLFALTACSRHDGGPEETQGGTYLSVTFPGIETPQTKAAGYADGSQNASEKLVNSLKAYIFDHADGKLLQISPANPSSSETYFTVEDQFGGRTVDVLFVANDNLRASGCTAGSTTFAEFQSVLTAEVSGTLTGPFVMLGEATGVTINARSMTGTVESRSATPLGTILLTRLAARIDITNAVTDASVTAVIDGAKIKNAAKASCIHSGGTACTDYISACSQVTNAGYCTVEGQTGISTADKCLMWSHLYAYANDHATSATKTTVEMSYTWNDVAKTAEIEFVDADGDPISIERNHRYEILLESDDQMNPEFTIRVLPWELINLDAGNVNTPSLTVAAPTFGTTGDYTAPNRTIEIGHEAQTITLAATSNAPVSLRVYDAEGTGTATWPTASHNVAKVTGSDYQGTLTLAPTANTTLERRVSHINVSNGQIEYVITLIQHPERETIVLNPTAADDANCFFVKPGPTAMKGYRVYPRRVDTFWGDADYNYTNITGNTLGTTTEWAIDLLWMDEPFMVSRKAGDGNIKLAKTTGTGVDDYFQIDIPASAKYGNFVVYIYKKSDASKTPLWSWHFWVTDYNPDLTGLTPVFEQYIYTTANGQKVHRLGNYTGSAYTYNTAWETGIHANSFMMDRSLGQREEYPVLMKEDAPGFLYYQWGRKDPFTNFVQLYDLNRPIIYDKAKHFVKGGTGTGITIADGVNHPNIMYSSVGWVDNYNWKPSGSSTPNGEVMLYLWNDPKLSGTLEDNRPTLPYLRELTGKSLYDPCPKGWKVPEGRVTWQNMNVLNDGNPMRANYYGSSGANGALFTCGIFYPAAGVRHALQNINSNDMASVNSSVSLWGSSPGISGDGIFASIQGGGIMWGVVDRAEGYQVRCISE